MHPRLIALATAILALCITFPASADPPGPRAYPVYILAIDSDDAEDQAEALTAALRSRARNAPGWSLSETSATLSMLTAALRCPRTPDATCLAKIGEQLKADRFIWGTLAKAPGSSVKADVHLWTRGKPDQVATEAYSDNLKDQNDERLGRIAQRLFDRLTGAASNGTVAVHAGDGGGVVLVDGQRRASLEKGDATVEVPAGSHTVEVRVQGFAPSKETVNVSAGKETRLAPPLTPSETAAPETSSSSGGASARAIGGWTAVGLGTVLLVAGAVEGVIWLNRHSQQNDLLAKFPKDTNVCDLKDTNPDAATACDNDPKARTASALGITFAATGAAAVAIGAYLVLSDSGSSGPEKKTAIRVAPAISPNTQGFVLSGAF